MDALLGPLMQVLLAVGGGIYTLLKSIKFVQEGELGIKLRFGKAVRVNGVPKVIPPGFVLLIPFVDTLRRQHVRQQTLRLDNQKVMIAQGLIFNVSAVVMFRIRDIYRALFEINDLNRALVDLSMGLLRDELAHKTHLELTDIEGISTGLLGRLKSHADEWGVEFIQFKLTDCAPTVETAPLINAQIGVTMKLNALETASAKLGVKLSDLSPVLAAALVGVPMVTAIADQGEQVVQRIKNVAAERRAEELRLKAEEEARQ